MTRPQKNVVAYFPHMCHHGKTMFCLESQFGNDGYTFWWKLLETLGDSEDHFYDLSNPANLIFLCSKSRVTEETARRILSLLASLGAIDQELYDHGIVWSQNFVDGISDVYTKNRGREAPTRPPVPGSFQPNFPGFTPEQPISPPENPQHSGITRGDYPQSKVKESKEKEIKADIAETAAEPGEDEDELFPTSEPESEQPDQQKQKKPRPPRSLAVLRFQELSGTWPNKVQISDIDQAVDDGQLDRWETAIKAWLRKGYRPTDVDGMLDFFKNGVPKNGNGKRKVEEPRGFNAVREFMKGGGEDGQP